MSGQSHFRVREQGQEYPQGQVPWRGQENDHVPGHFQGHSRAHFRARGLSQEIGLHDCNSWNWA